ncbi:hypothetical protein [Streptomyces purpurogeneiscleroticus]|uniref:hypothetical protein n=1 Tax=Streptomyces purpurogeneiscleroticus TaxID=68259 RepID=UPI001CBE0788|nr:hypothetical protein [Streptomyces purpurogeneiscleroticus]MBZ4017511.1 hypothetical protein [Streptomyces purpurogeneiscleroticus]
MKDVGELLRERAEKAEAAGKADKAAKLRLKADKADGKVPAEFAEHYRVDVTENIATAGSGMTKGMKYRWALTDTDTDRPVKVGYALTVKDGYRRGDHYRYKLWQKQG